MMIQKRSEKSGCFFGGKMKKRKCIAFLCIVYDEQLGITALTPWTVLGAALLGSIGISFFYTPKRRYKGHLFEKKEGIESIETVEGEEEMEFVAKFGGSIKYINSEDFRAARVEACLLYTSDAADEL